MKKHSTLVCLSLSCLLIFAGCAQTPADDSSSTVDSHTTTKSTAVDVTTTIKPSASTTTSKKTNTYTIKIAQEELHTAITMTLDKQAYAPDEIIHVTITNGTEDKIMYGPGFRILKPRNNGEYQIVHNSYGTNAVLYTVGKDSSKTDRVKLTHYQVESKQAYKMALNIDSKWVIADFQITDE